MDTHAGSGVALPALTVYRFHLTLALGARRHTLPAYLGSTVRGVFAAAFRQVVCVTRAPVCDGCALLSRCAYPYVFETPPPTHLPATLRKRFQQAPRPYVFAVPLRYAHTPTLELGLVLVGQAIDFLPYFLYVIQEMGQQGLGRARVPYQLAVVWDENSPERQVVYSAERGILRNEVQSLTLESLQTADDRQVQQLTLHFLTPLRLKKWGAYQEGGERLDFAALVDLLLGRLEALALFHCHAAWAPNQALRAAAQHVRVTQRDFTLQHLERYSNRHHKRLPLHGILGSVTFAGPLGAFLPWLRLGQYLHLGAGTAFGLGQYRLESSVVSG